MAKQKQANRVPLGVIAGISAAVVAVAGGGAWWALKSAKSPTPTLPPTTIAPSPSPEQTPIEQTAQIYWLQDTGNELKLVPKPVTIAASQPNAVLEAAFTRLFEGPQDAALNSTIPKETKLRSLTIQNDGIHVNLSEEFTTGGGSAAMTGRLAQVVYTATSLQPNANVWIDVEGKPLEVLGGEGLLLEQPLTRQSVQENFTL